MAWNESEFIELCAHVFSDERGKRLLNILKEYYVDIRYEKPLMEQNNNKLIWMIGQRDIVQKLLFAVDVFNSQE
jgi:hypothetical protein